ncbi:hypothetical protein KSC_030190 [Ktedonobacter sp. SOSP1-52]|nr:hypothetical protein KSC_030190 [Ktedonobacter sp. SOSP1-52]
MLVCRCKFGNSQIYTYQSRNGQKDTQKNELKPWLKKSWCFPKEVDGNFVYHMEDVLEVYCQPYDPAIPRICMDEMGKNLVKEKYPSEPAKPGQVVRKDYTYEKRLCCKDSRGKTMGVPSRFLSCLGDESKQAGNEGNLSNEVSFFYPVNLSLTNHVHTLIAL